AEQPASGNERKSNGGCDRAFAPAVDGADRGRGSEHQKFAVCPRPRGGLGNGKRRERGAQKPPPFAPRLRIEWRRRIGRRGVAVRPLGFALRYPCRSLRGERVKRIVAHAATPALGGVRSAQSPAGGAMIDASQPAVRQRSVTAAAALWPL